MKSINFCNEKRHFAIKNTLFVTKNLIFIIHKANFAILRDYRMKNAIFITISLILIFWAVAH